MANVVDTRGIQFEITTPQALPDDRWSEYMELERQFYTENFPNRSVAEIENFLDVNGEPDFRARRCDPNLVVGERFRAGQEFYDPQLVLGTNRKGEMVTAVYSVGNVSGNHRDLKRTLLVKSYVAIQSPVEAPDYMERGLIETGIALSFRGVKKRVRPGAVYPLLEEVTFRARTQALGFRGDPETAEPVPYFGADFPAGKQYREAVRAGQLVVHKVASLPGGRESLRQARRTLKHND